MNEVSFKTTLAYYKKVIDADVVAYSKRVQKTTLQQYGADARVPTDVFLEILARGGKRIRGALTMLGYEMSGGQDQAMIAEAACAVEMIHAYFLIMDDIQDRSSTRRGGPSGHKLLEQYHGDHRLAGDREHFGIAMALNAMGVGNHAAQVVLANLNVDQDLRLKALSILNQTAVTTAHGQTGDIMNEVKAEVTLTDVEHVYEWKTARYTILNPLHMGMVLAGADCASTDAITNYAINVGKAFQLTDDILGTFGEEFESGKSPMDDVKEGKRTLLSIYAVEHASNGNKNFLIQMLGNQSITPEQFMRYKEIVVETGALTFAAHQAEMYVETAIASLETHEELWKPEAVSFLKQLAQYLLVRTS